MLLHGDGGPFGGMCVAELGRAPQFDAEHDLHGVKRLRYLIGNAKVDLLDSTEQGRRPAGV